MKYNLALILNIAITSAYAYADNIPADFLYAGKPVDPLCFEDFSETNIRLNNCGILKEKLTIIGKNDKLIKEGYIGFDWKGVYDPHGYSYYKVFPAENNKYWVYTISSGGGSGVFTQIKLVERNDSTFKVNNIIGGDRCNGGIQNVSEKNQRLSFSRNLTPYSLFAMANSNPHQLKGYEDLAECSICCVADAFYEVDSTLKPRLQYVDLGNDPIFDDTYGQGNYEACFNKLLASYINRGETKLNNAKLNELVKEFNDTCVK